ncbi:serine protein kinase [Bradymonadaceae bacterium TMQ3]|uniref:Serine protein kinase n=1 Tax=Lujinxingia sediminis TaxID=2480984 RepID=A0ABY0CR82_9DELT|nr:serine protein kinase [Lujinxingia sediminis]RDV38468.1 serine protein kinase [Bradymonadaceae bacterium TMQ3]RVU42626.1 serine protein kinase [Lujinxingia sediminis]TXC76764.1 serine protein kinase [Bradymonadales bacterium TMQ1]
MSAKESLLHKIGRHHDIDEYRELHWEGSFEEYLDLVREDVRVTRNAYQRIYDMVMSYGTEEYIDNKKKIVRYNFFKDEITGGADAIYGLDIPLMRLVNVFKAAANEYGTEKRIILLHGPVGSSKSTIARLLKKGLEEYTRTEDGRLYTFSWVMPKELQHLTGGQEVLHDPMNEEPLKLIPQEWRAGALEELGIENVSSIRVRGDLNPASRFIFKELMRHYGGDWSRAMEHVRVRRMLFSEKDRVGIGTFQPKDEKNQDSTELTGDINYRKIAIYGSDSDPRAFNFDGEFCVANRGIIEFVEILKLDVAFLYDLLGATQERKIKPKKFAQTDIDEVIIGHTNEPEYRKLLGNEYMEALRDRTVKIDIPYITKYQEEIRIYKKDFNNQRVKGKHIAPHTIEMAAMWAVLTRLEDPKKHDLTLLQKLKLYDGKSLTGYTQDNVKELRKETLREGLTGVSPRYIQDKLSNALVSDKTESSINPFLVLNELEGGLKNHSLISNEEERGRYRELLAVVKQEYEDIVKNEVQRAISADEDAISKLCANYIDNVKAYTQKEKVRNKYTGQYEEPDERLMRSIEEKIDIPDSRKDDFRREIMNYIGALAIDGKQFTYQTNERLRKALELKLFEDQKDSIKLASVVSNVVDRDTQEKIDIVKQRLIRDYGYNEESATDVLNFVASIFARGDSKQQ